MAKHIYNGWEIKKVRDGYVAQRQSDCHVAPETYALLRHAKQAIDDGSAALTVAQLVYKQLAQDWDGYFKAARASERDAFIRHLHTMLERGSTAAHRKAAAALLDDIEDKYKAQRIKELHAQRAKAQQLLDSAQQQLDAINETLRSFED